MTPELQHGTLGVEYAVGRQRKKSLRYRLRRRSYEVIQSIQKYHTKEFGTLLDIGTADGLMLSHFKRTFPRAQCIGIELSMDLIEFNKDEFIKIIQADTLRLPFKNDSVDITVSAALIEHVTDPILMMKEIHRVLPPGGIHVLTAPDPVWEHIATFIGHLPREQHCKVMNLEELERLLMETGFSVLEKKKFMLSPIGLPFELTIENIIRRLRLNFLFANQLIIGRKI